MLDRWIAGVTAQPPVDVVALGMPHVHPLQPPRSEDADLEEVPAEHPPVRSVGMDGVLPRGVASSGWRDSTAVSMDLEMFPSSIGRCSKDPSRCSRLNRCRVSRSSTSCHGQHVQLGVTDPSGERVRIGTFNRKTCSAYCSGSLATDLAVAPDTAHGSSSVSGSAERPHREERP